MKIGLSNEAASRHAPGLLWLAALLLTSAVNMEFDAPPAAFVSGMLLLAFFPGVLLSRLLLGPKDFDLTTRFVIGVGLSLALNATGYLCLCYAFGKVTRPMLVGLILIYGISFLGLYQWKAGTRPRGFHRYARWNTAALSLLVLGALLRFTYLGYSDFQGDEAGNCMLNSVQLVEGNSSVLLTPLATRNRRPPVQVLVPAMSYLLVRTTDEGVSRFPFALASLISVWLIYVLGRDMFNRPLAGFVSGLLASLNGYFVVYARTVQYQSILFLFLLLSFLFLWRFMKSVELETTRKYLFLSVACFSFASLSHFEAFLFLFVGIYAFISRGFRTGWTDYLRLSSGTVLILALIVGLFYIPLFLEPSTNYVLGEHWKSRHDASLHFNIGLFFTNIPFYNSNPYLIGILILAPFAFLFKEKEALWLILCWFGTFFIYYMVLCDRPRTHVITFFPPWIILAGLGYTCVLDLISDRLMAHPMTDRLIVGLLGAALICIGINAGFRIHKLFIKNSPEYIWALPRNQIHLKALFGFPYQRGWKAAGALFRTGELTGPYFTNESSKISHFYLRQKRKRLTNAKYFLAVLRPRSFRDPNPIPEDFQLRARILRENEPSILIYERGGRPATVIDYNSEALGEIYFALDKEVGLRHSSGIR